ncbi:MAG: site-specific integrase, partial [Oscillospiraceae bacterium]|nr:site-specific integrase [Oscillospiraceae bacterium]
MSRTGENIYRRKDGRWEARYIAERRADGRAIYKSFYARTYAEAKRKQTEVTARQLLALPPEKPSEILLETFAANWLAAVRLRVKASTYGKYERIVRLHVMAVIGNQRVAALSQGDVERFAQGLMDGGLSAKSVQDILIVMKGILKYGKIPIDCSAISVRSEQREMRVLSKPEQDALALYLTQNADAITLGVLLSLYTGIRIGELCALRWENIDLVAQTLRITGTMQRIPDFTDGAAKTQVVITSPKSKCSVRTIPLPEFLVKLLHQ